jgi:hypothetical protein
MCKNGFGFDDVKTSLTVEYGGSNPTCGQIFNTLFSREEQESEDCSLISQDLASKCCYYQCSLCGGLQTDSALSVMHDETQMGCSEFDSYIFSSRKGATSATPSKTSTGKLAPMTLLAVCVQREMISTPPKNPQWYNLADRK